MPSINAEIPAYQEPGLGGGFDLVQQITAAGLQRIFRTSIDMDKQASVIPAMIAKDEKKRQEYIDHKLWKFDLKMGDFDVRLEKEPAYLRLEGKVEMHIEDGAVLRGPLMIRIPLRSFVSNHEPRVVLHCIHMKSTDVTLSYRGPRPADACQFAAEDHAALLWAGFLLQDAIDLTARQAQLNPAGLNKQAVDFEILPDANPLRTVLSIRYAFHAHDEHNSIQLERWLVDRYGTEPFGGASGGSRIPANGESDEAEDIGLQFLPISDFSFGGEGLQPQFILERVCKYENMPVKGQVRAEMRPNDAGKIEAHFEELKSITTGLAPGNEVFEKRLLESFKSIGPKVVIDIPYASGQVGVPGAPQYPIRGLMHHYHHKQSHQRLFIERPLPRALPHVNMVPPQDEMAIALDRTFVSGMVWDAFSAINIDLRARFGVPGDLSRWSAECEEDEIRVEALIDIDGWLDPGKIMGTFKAAVKDGDIEIKPDLHFDLPVTAKLIGISAGLGVLVPGGGLGFCLTAFFTFLGFGAMQTLNATLNSGVGSNSGLDMDMLELRISENGAGYRPRFRTAQNSSAGILLTGHLEKIVQPLDQNQHPLTIDGHPVYQLTGRQEVDGRTVAYRLNSGDIVPLDQLVLLVEAGLPLPDVHVVHAAAGSYLRADPDETDDNNLAKLPPVPVG